jgi:RNA polymerase sigma-70 factor (ECF subfamily)
MTDLTPEDDLDARLVERAVGGDELAFADLVRRHQARALRLAFVICGSTQEAEDAVQDAFVKTYAALPRVRPHTAVRPWLMRIVANTARNRRRSAGRRERATARSQAQASSGSRSVEDDALAVLRDEALLTAVSRLGWRERRVLGLRYFAGLSEAETAAALGIAVGTVKSRSSRALRRLHDELAEQTRG